MIFRTLSHHLVLALPLYWLAVGVHAVPVPLGIANPDDHSANVQDFRVVNKAFTAAQSYLESLHTYLHDSSHPNPQIGDMILEKAFGKVKIEQKQAIIKNIADLLQKTAKIRIKSLRIPATGKHTNVVAFVDEVQPRNLELNLMTITEHFYKLNEIDQAGLVIHEATHAVLATFDCFMTIPPYSAVPIPDPDKIPENVSCGYEHESLSALVKSQHANIVENADSYAVAAIYAHNIRRESELPTVQFTKSSVERALGKTAFTSHISSRATSLRTSSSVLSGVSTSTEHPPHTAGHDPSQGLGSTSTSGYTGGGFHLGPNPPAWVEWKQSYKSPPNPLLRNAGLHGGPAQPVQHSHTPQGGLPPAPGRQNTLPPVSQNSLPQSGSHGSTSTGRPAYEGWRVPGMNPPNHFLSSGSAGLVHATSNPPALSVPAAPIPQSGATTNTATGQPAWKNWVNEVRPSNGPT